MIGSIAISRAPSARSTSFRRSSLRQPGAEGALADAQAILHASGAPGRPIDLLAGLARHHRAGAIADLHLDPEPVAAGQAAGRIDQDGLRWRALWHVGKPDLRSAFLEQPLQPRNLAVAPDRQARVPGRALQRWRARLRLRR